MPDYKAPLRDMRFVLHEVLQAEKQWAAMPATAEVNRELADAVLEEAAKLSQNLVSPINRSGDEEGVHWSPEGVKTAAGYREAYAEMAAGGWLGLTGNPDFGGQGMPKALSVMFEEMMAGASVAFHLYPMLTMGAALALEAGGSEELKTKYLPKMYDGTWAGSMCLTESHAGTDLGMIRSKAIPNANGSYDITGTKIFITGGEHDLTENIIHLVLAKLPDAPAGSRGISLFLVPKFKVDEAGNCGDTNGVSCGSIEHKMGIHASATCVMNFDGSEGFLVGEVNKGLAAMFVMMNYERLSVGIQGLGCAQAAYQWSSEYAVDRVQSRSPEGPKNPDAAADPIVVHPDVRRMLLTQKAYTEGCRALAIYVGQQLDGSKYGSGAEQEKCSQLLALLTPVTKGYLSDRGLDCCVMGQQVFGGHGYVREWGMEQLVRDVRITQIYEGTNGIQALDLMGRKVVANQGSYMALMIQEMRDFVSSVAGRNELEEFTAPLSAAIDRLEATTADVLAQSASDPNAIGAASVDYMDVTGLTLLGWMWARMAAVALEAGDDAYYTGKVQTARFFMQRLLPRAESLCVSISAGSGSMMAVPEDCFGVV